MTFDQQQENKWCFYQLSSMYYYATGELRALNYGNLHYNPANYSDHQWLLNDLIQDVYRWPVNDENLATKKYFKNGGSVYTQEFFDAGADLFQVHDFRDYYLDISLHEFEKKYQPSFERFVKNPVALDPEAEKERIRREKEEARREKQRQKEEERKRKEKEKLEKQKKKAEEKRRKKEERERRKRERRNNRNN